jgi:hypothetical protein
LQNRNNEYSNKNDDDDNKRQDMDVTKGELPLSRIAKGELVQ